MCVWFAVFILMCHLHSIKCTPPATFWFWQCMHPIQTSGERARTYCRHRKLPCLMPPHSHLTRPEATHQCAWSRISCKWNYTAESFYLLLSLSIRVLFLRCIPVAASGAGLFIVLRTFSSVGRQGLRLDSLPCTLPPPFPLEGSADRWWLHGWMDGPVIESINEPFRHHQVSLS